jgi:hypothetical protein
MSKNEVEYGYFDTPHYSGLNMATLASIHEEGWNKLPARNFIYSTSINFKGDLNKLTKTLMADIASGVGWRKGLERIGKAGVRKIAYTIDTGTFSNPKVSKDWAAVKGFDDALKHYGDLKSGATFKISKGQKE